MVEMFPSKGGGGFVGQQPYATQQAYGQHPGSGFSGNPTAGSDMGTQHGLASRQPSMVGGLNSKGAVSSSLQGRAAYPSLAESSKYSTGAHGSSFSEDYLLAANHGYAQKGDQFSGTKGSDYAVDRRPYADLQGPYAGRELQNDTTRRYTDSGSLSHQHQTDIQDHMDQVIYPAYMAKH
ncbi:hypothetical protein HPP92_001784 [Vanilla planifolia]|uniref:Uncharacterized protein n=1 Tax=Vanilla planifolia TaxID=51239 RepID=A0A835VJZ9_VANPL|nr:hypothetical protein HPP92_001784 [Vanilla planifolia]